MTTHQFTTEILDHAGLTLGLTDSKWLEMAIDAIMPRFLEEWSAERLRIREAKRVNLE